MNKIWSTAALAVLVSYTQVHANSDRQHFFDQPYQCDRSREVTSSRTGETRTVHYRNVYFPSMDWQFSLTDTWDAKEGLGGRGVANLFTPNFRYDGVYRDDGTQITSISMGTAWEVDDKSPGVSLRSSKDSDASNCNPLDEVEIQLYAIDYLDGLEVMTN